MHKITNMTESIIRTATHEFAEMDEVEILEETDTHIEYFDKDGGYSRIYYYPEKINNNHIQDILIADDHIWKYINKNRFIDFVTKEIDRNALSVCRNIILIWDGRDVEPSKAREQLYDLYFDEYAFEIGYGMCGITWVERQAVIVNISEIKIVSDEFHDDKCHEDFCLGVLSTLFHEFRHLVYECNEILSIDTEEYPQDGGIEENVEEYGNQNAERVYMQYENMFLTK